MDTDGLKRSYTSVQLHGGIVMQCANDSKHPARTQAEQFVDWLELLRDTDKSDGTGVESSLAEVG